MRLHSGAPFWLVRNGLEEMATTLPRDCDVAVLGAGVTGALVADALVAEGLSVVIVDRRAPACGSTAASTALLQYELDFELGDLIKLVGEAHAVRAYRLCAAAIDTLEQIIASLGEDCGFHRRSSLYLATRRRDGQRIKSEAEVRLKFGLDVEHWSRAQVEAMYGFGSHGALRTASAAVVDPIRLTRALLERAVGRGATLVSRTAVSRVDSEPAGVRVVTEHGDFRARRVVYALGYEVPEPLRSEVVKLHSSYALVTEPLEHFGPWYDECVVWETARPYHYLRTTDDGRILIGGADVPFRDSAMRDRLLSDRTRRLERRLTELLPALRTETAFAWAGTFGETRDGLPFIGPSEALPHALFALGYGGNGITFSVLAAQLLTDLCLGRDNEDAVLFRLDR